MLGMLPSPYHIMHLLNAHMRDTIEPVAITYCLLLYRYVSALLHHRQSRLYTESSMNIFFGLMMREPCRTSRGITRLCVCMQCSTLHVHITYHALHLMTQIGAYKQASRHTCTHMNTSCATRWATRDGRLETWTCKLHFPTRPRKIES